MSHPTQRANKLFMQTFGTTADEYYTAPGRVNIIGDHTDYNDGFVLPAAINFNIIIAVKRREDTLFRAVSETFPGELAQWHFGEEGPKSTQASWSHYLKGFTSAMAAAGLPVKGLDVAIISNIPLGAGLSSSAAVEVAFGTAINESSQLKLSPLAIAHLARRCENEYVGYACGSMDQIISALGEQDHALLIDCEDHDSTAVPLPDNLTLLIINSHVDQSQLETEYRIRREQCDELVETLGIESLRHISLAQLEYAKDQLSDTLYRRAKHVITENRRTQQASHALESGNIKRLSKLMAQSHQSMKENFEITVPEIDILVEIIAEVIGERGGVRMTGSSFGGSVVALVDHSQTDAVIEAIEQKYQPQTGLEASVYLCSACSGARRVFTE